MDLAGCIDMAVDRSLLVGDSYKGHTSQGQGNRHWLIVFTAGCIDTERCIQLLGLPQGLPPPAYGFGRLLRYRLPSAVCWLAV